MREVGEYLRKSDGSGSGDEEDGEAGEDRWEGFEEISVSQIDRLDEYIDEDRYAAVTVEDVNVSREGLIKAGQSNTVHTVGDGEHDVGELRDKVISGGHANGMKKKREWTKEKPTSAKKKRKTFRYETKEERKKTRLKERRKKKVRRG